MTLLFVCFVFWGLVACGCGCFGFCCCFDVLVGGLGELRERL